MCRTQRNALASLRWRKHHAHLIVTAFTSLDGVMEAPGAVHGSATLGARLADAGLVDRYHLLVFPVLLGAGKRLWSEADKGATKVRLTDHAVDSNGIQKQVFEVVR